MASSSPLRSWMRWGRTDATSRHSRRWSGRFEGPPRRLPPEPYPRSVTRLPVAVEAGDKKVFASALDWPGWARAAKTEGAAIETLLAYAPRYAAVAREAGLDFPESFDAEAIEREAGGSGTDFGVPSSLTLQFDGRAVDPAEAERLASIVAAAWTTFDHGRRHEGPSAAPRARLR